jgi:hypothetical protein
MRKNLWLVLMMALVLGFPWLASSVASNLETTAAPEAQPVLPTSNFSPTSGLPPYESGLPNLPLDLIIVAVMLFAITYLGWRKGGERDLGNTSRLDPLGMTLAACLLLALFIVIDGLRGIMPTISGPSLTLSYVPLGAIAVAIVIAGFMILRRTAGRARSATWRPPSVATEEERQEFASLLEQASQSLKAGREPRSVIIECYRALCEVLQKHGAVNSPSMTAREFEGASQRSLAIRPDLLHRFTALFEKARYSDEVIFAEEASESESMLDALKSDIGRVPGAK